MLFDLTFAQLLTLVETRNAREKRAYEDAERRANEQNDDGRSPLVPPKQDLSNPENLPSVSDISRVFGGMMG